ncbi:DUF4132 domain-containing protein [Pseudomonas paralcaligenes]|uniref:DUF4132 domain-containing protein n=1 Tax=Pseudomonas paralcaligenes TaxID=2772558 RepID=UPI001C7FE1A0|nr:DUF4132 domain-containing protein [Pseudomonas paralcaligenes]
MSSNFEVIIHLAEAHGHDEFLRRLEQAYRERDVGQDLDFACIEGYWRGEAALPEAWRQRLAQEMIPGQRQAQYFSISAVSSAFYGWALGDLPLPAWLACWERLVVVLAPFTSDCYLASNWMPRAHYVDGKIPAREWEGVMRGAMLAWAGALATGEGEWGGLHRWLLDAQADPGWLQRVLAGIPKLSSSQLDVLLNLRLYLTIVREQLLLGEQGPDHWIDWLYSFVSRLDDLPYRLNLRGDMYAFCHNLALPTLRLLAVSPRLAEGLLSEDHNRKSASNTLFSMFDLSVLMAEPLPAFVAWLDSLPGQVVGGLRSSERFVTGFPAASLALEQRRFAAKGEIYCFPISPEAVGWYRQIIGRVPSGDRLFERLCEVLKDQLAEEQFHEVIASVVANDERAWVHWDILSHALDTDRLYAYLEAANDSLRHAAVRRLMKLAVTLRQPGADPKARDAWQAEPENRQLLERASQAYPHLFISALFVHDLWSGADSFERWAILWRAASPDDRQRMAGLLLGSLHYAQRGFDEPVRFAESRYAEAPEAFQQYIAKEHPYNLSDIAALLGAIDSPLQALTAAVAVRFIKPSQRPGKAIFKAVRRSLSAYPDSFSALEQKEQLRLLPLMDEACVEACRDALIQLLGSSSRPVRVPAAALIARCSPELIERCALLDTPPKPRKTILTGMALSRASGMAGLIARHLDDKAHDDYSRSLSLDALERAQYPLQGLDPWLDLDLAALQAIARDATIAPAVDLYWDDRVAQLTEALGEALGRYALSLLAESGEGGLPRRVRQITRLMPAGRCSDLALHAVEFWILREDSTEFDWLLPLLDLYGDERAVNALVKAIKGWKKQRKAKAALGLRTLCRIPGVYGASQVRELWENGKFAEALKDTTRQILVEAAQQQDMDLDEFLELLVPDFGMQRDGLRLDVGSTVYTVRIAADMSLVVVAENGKAGKSLPKAKASEDPAKRDLAEAQFKALSKNLKPVLKQQGKRLVGHFQLGTSWTAQTWRRLFVEQPLMSCIGQAVVWAAEDADGQPLVRFRPDATGVLIGLDDAPVELPADAQVHIAHPLELDAAEREAWAQHMADYELTSPIGQWEAAVCPPTEQELGAEQIDRAKGVNVTRAQIGGLLDRWGYTKGHTGDGAMIDDHYAYLDNQRWMIRLDHDGFSVIFEAEESVEVGSFTVSRKDDDGPYVPQRLKDLPPTLLNTLLAQAETLVRLESA